MELSRSLQTDLRKGQIVEVKLEDFVERCTVQRIESIPDARRRVPQASAPDRCFLLMAEAHPEAQVAWLTHPIDRRLALALGAEASGYPVFVLGSEQKRYRDLIGRPINVSILQSRPEVN
jgi:hypothetical protein